MANIYLRTSKYVAAFMRAIGDGQSLPMTTPIEFSQYTEEYVVLTNGLRIIPEAQQHRASCYSQSSWQNMLRGRLPNGGKPIINRNPDDYLTYAEICTLERLPNKTKTEAYEFLCIAVPREVFIDGRVQRISKSYTLDTRAANQLRQIKYWSASSWNTTYLCRTIRTNERDYVASPIDGNRRLANWSKILPLSATI